LDVALNGSLADGALCFDANSTVPAGAQMTTREQDQLNLVDQADLACHVCRKKD
jgi:hypothetical protein